MRRRIIEALTYPRILMTSLMDFQDCPMNRYFNDNCQDCGECEQGKECLWLNNQDEFSVLAERPIDVLFEALTFSLDYVDRHVSREQHNVRRCICDSCVWVRDTRHLAKQYKGHSASISRACIRHGP